MENEPKIEQNEMSFDVEDIIKSDIAKNSITSREFFEFKNNPNKIVRFESFDELNIAYENKIEIAELVKIAKELYKELQDKYSILVPADFNIGKDKEGRDAVYSTIDRIKGKHLGEVKVSDEVIAQIKTLYASVAKYYLEKYQSREFYLWDLNSQTQYIYGKRIGEKENQIYLIDTDIRISKSQMGMYITVMWLTRHMIGVERHLNTKFEIARDYITKFVAQPLPEDLDDSEKNILNENVENIWNFLNDKEFGPKSKSAVPPFE